VVWLPVDLCLASPVQNFRWCLPRTAGKGFGGVSTPKTLPWRTTQMHCCPSASGVPLPLLPTQPQAGCIRAALSQLSARAEGRSCPACHGADVGPVLPGGAPASQPHAVARDLQAEWLQPIAAYSPRAMSIYLQRLGKTNTDNSGALLKRETACRQHNMECLFRNCRAEAHTFGPELQGQSVGSLKTGSVLTPHTVNSEIPILPWDWCVCLFISHGSRTSGTPRGGKGRDLTPPQTSGGGAGRLHPARCSEPGSEAWQIRVWQGQARLRRQMVDSWTPAMPWSVAGALQFCIQFCLLNLPICFPSFHALVKARGGRDYLLSQAPQCNTQGCWQSCSQRSVLQPGKLPPTRLKSGSKEQA